MLKAILESLDGLSEEESKHYTQTDDGKYKLDVEGVGGLALEDVSGLKSALSKERTRADDGERRLKAFADLDPEKARDALARIDKLADIDPDKDVDKLVEERVSAIRDKMNEQHAKELKARDDRNAALEAENTASFRLGVLNKAFDQAGVMPERRMVLEAYVDKYIKTEERDGVRSVVVLDDDGNPRISGDGSNMSPEQFLGGLSKDSAFAAFFKGTDKSGGGTPPGQGGGTAHKTTSKMSRSEKAKAIAAGDLKPTDLV